jgi:hypothetical protein
LVRTYVTVSARALGVRDSRLAAFAPVFLFCCCCSTASSFRYVSGYSLNFENYVTGELDTLCSDGRRSDTMFRVVVKSNLTLYLAQDLIGKLDEVLPLLDQNASQKAGEHRAPSLRAMVYAAKAAGTLASNASSSSTSRGGKKQDQRRDSILHGQHATC